MDATSWSALGTWVTAAIYVALLAYAIIQVGEAKKLRGSQVRPFVVVDIEPGFLLYLTIENIGTTLARDVKVSFDPPLTATVNKPWDFAEAPLLTEGLETFPPKKRHRIFFDALHDRLTSDPPQCMRYRATVTYRNDEGRSFTDNYTLDIRSMLNTSEEEKGLPALAEEAAKIRKQLDKISDAIRDISKQQRASQSTPAGTNPVQMAPTSDDH